MFNTQKSGPIQTLSSVNSTLEILQWHFSMQFLLWSWVCQKVTLSFFFSKSWYCLELYSCICSPQWNSCGIQFLSLVQFSVISLFLYLPLVSSSLIILCIYYLVAPLAVIFPMFPFQFRDFFFTRFSTACKLFWTE